MAQRSNTPFKTLKSFSRLENRAAMLSLENILFLLSSMMKMMSFMYVLLLVLPMEEQEHNCCSSSVGQFGRQMGGD